MCEKSAKRVRTIWSGLQSALFHPQGIPIVVGAASYVASLAGLNIEDGYLAQAKLGIGPKCQVLAIGRPGRVPTFTILIYDLRAGSQEV
jgi:hypothetical protein